MSRNISSRIGLHRFGLFWIAFPVLGLVLLCASVCTSAVIRPQLAPAVPQPAGPQIAQLANQVNSAVLSIPFLSIFDNLQYDVMGTEVILRGQVVQEATKHDAVEAVRHIEGVSNVVDEIEVLPVDIMDEGIRRAEYRAIYGDPALERYAIGALPSIHIVVGRGHVTLEGVVDDAMDSQIAYNRALTISNVFSVTNHLQVRHP